MNHSSMTFTKSSASVACVSAMSGLPTVLGRAKVVSSTRNEVSWAMIVSIFCPTWHSCPKILRLIMPCAIQLLGMITLETSYT